MWKDILPLFPKTYNLIRETIMMSQKLNVTSQLTYNRRIVRMQFIDTGLTLSQVYRMGRI